MNSFRSLLILFFITTSFISSFAFAISEQKYSPSQQLTQMLKTHHGKVIYLDFWASWCGPCRESFPWMNNLQSKYKHKGFVVLSVNVDNDKAFADKFLTELPAKFSVIYDPKGKIARQYKLKGMPSSYILNRAGEVVSAHVGFNEQKKVKFEQEILSLLNQSSTY